MRSVFVIIAHILSKQPSEMCFVENHNVVEHLPSGTANPALRRTVLPWRFVCCPRWFRAPRGAYFYNEQDLARAVRGEGLMLTFGSYR